MSTTTLLMSADQPIHDVDIRLPSASRRASLRAQAAASNPPGTPGSPSSPTRKNRKKKKKNGFNSTFGKIKAIDPLAEENKKHLQNMEKGFLELLELHNTMELSSLCGMLAIKIERKTKNTEKVRIADTSVRTGTPPLSTLTPFSCYSLCSLQNDLIMKYIRAQCEEGTPPDQVYVNVLKHMWEGTLFEYLRAKGQPLHSTENDPRGFVIAYWRKMTKTVVPFDPYYVPQNLTNRAKSEKRSEDIVAILDTMEAKEVNVKAAEQKIRREHGERQRVAKRQVAT